MVRRPIRLVEEAVNAISYQVPKSLWFFVLYLGDCGGFGGGLGAAGAGREAMASTRATLPPLGAVMAGAPANAQRGAMQAPAVGSHMAAGAATTQPNRLPLPRLLPTLPRLRGWALNPKP